ncbi:MAG: phosphoesterase [Sulfobacillus benefaciens]|uniref:Phosphoesterase n=1 Tax=Sulfobacillus benefaciens TaxID=453960 RepID=A0A2T2XBA2_9FIRM|nr:MAG: phosphoesterase [Sulfobacillus benefaciens]
MNWSSVTRWLGRLVMGSAGLVVLLLVIVKLTVGVQFQKSAIQEKRPALPRFTHVIVIMMENHGDRALMHNPRAGYIDQLMRSWGYDTNYYGLTHPSLPNYVGALSGRTMGSHSDSPVQRFKQMTLVQQLDRRHISWQAVMQSIPSSGFRGNWYPDRLPKNHAPIVAPPTALYAKKHNPFALFPALNPSRGEHTVNLTQFQRELASGHLAQFTWITPNLCNDMHGQSLGAGAECPVNNPALLVSRGNEFLRQLIPAILRSKAWNTRSVIFLTWDETNDPTHFLSAAGLRSYLRPGPASPMIPVFNIAIGGGRVPLLVLYGRYPHAIRTNLWADHYSVLKTIEDSWHLPYLGHAANARVPVLTPFFTQNKTSSAR